MKVLIFIATLLMCGCSAHTINNNINVSMCVRVI